MTTINQLLNVKGHGYLSVGPGSLLVMDGDALVGIVTERHYARDVILKGRTSPQTLVRDIMETEVACVEPDETVEACLRLMTEERVRHLPVVGGGRVVGIVSIGDLVKSIIDEQRFTIDQLETYIHGERITH